MEHQTRWDAEGRPQYEIESPDSYHLYATTYRWWDHDDRQNQDLATACYFESAPALGEKDVVIISMRDAVSADVPVRKVGSVKMTIAEARLVALDILHSCQMAANGADFGVDGSFIDQSDFSGRDPFIVEIGDQVFDSDDAFGEPS